MSGTRQNEERQQTKQNKENHIQILRCERGTQLPPTRLYSCFSTSLGRFVAHIPYDFLPLGIVSLLETDAGLSGVVVGDEFGRELATVGLRSRRDPIFVSIHPAIYNLLPISLFQPS